MAEIVQESGQENKVNASIMVKTKKLQITVNYDYIFPWLGKGLECETPVRRKSMVYIFKLLQLYNACI